MSNEIHTDYLERALMGRPGTPINLAVTDVSARTLTALSACQLYMFQSKIDVCINFGDVTVEATTDNCRLVADLPYLFTPEPESNLYVAAIRDGDIDGALQITPMIGG